MPRVLDSGRVKNVAAARQVSADTGQRLFAGWRCHAYCLMSYHYHLLVRTPDADLSVGMWRLNQRHALRINRRHSFVGYVFEGRFFAELIENDRYFVAVARYVRPEPRAGNYLPVC